MSVCLFSLVCVGVSGIRVCVLGCVSLVFVWVCIYELSECQASCVVMIGLCCFGAPFLVDLSVQT